MLSPALLTRVRAAIGRLCTSTGQLQKAVRVQVTGGRVAKGWSNEGAPFKCCLYTPKASEVPEPLALLNKSVYMLAWVGDVPITSIKRVLVDGHLYEIHGNANDRTNQFLPTAMVSRISSEDPIVPSDQLSLYPDVYPDYYP